MQQTFEKVAQIISANGDVPLGDIKPESHVMKDLGVDSLAFLDIAFEIDQTFSIKLPIEDWMQSGNEGKVAVSTPIIEGAKVVAEVLSHVKGDKVLVLKKKRRKGYQKLNGHRQQFTQIRVKEIIA